MLRDAATTCDASHHLRANFQGLEAFALLTVEEEFQLARLLAAAEGLVVPKNGTARRPSRAARRGPAWEGRRLHARRIRLSRIK